MSEPTTPNEREELEGLRAVALEIFDGPECPQAVRDAIEWYHSSILAALSRTDPAVASTAAVPEGAEAVAWAAFAEDGNVRLWSRDSKQVREFCESAGLELTPLFAHPPRESGDAEDAARYRLLREMDWFDSPLCVVRDPKKNVRFGTDCPSRDRLDAAIDAAIRSAAYQGKEGGGRQ